MSNERYCLFVPVLIAVTIKNRIYIQGPKKYAKHIFFLVPGIGMCLGAFSARSVSRQNKYWQSVLMSWNQPFSSFSVLFPKQDRHGKQKYFVNSSSQIPAGGCSQPHFATPGKGTTNKVAKSRMQSLYWTCEKVWHCIAEWETLPLIKGIAPHVARSWKNTSTLATDLHMTLAKQNPIASIDQILLLQASLNHLLVRNWNS